ncbi:MAG: metal-dependent hydrolase [Oleibacter sp.]|nr:metal-dependent hydrolase [Thalassolituus sp.]
MNIAIDKAANNQTAAARTIQVRRMEFNFEDINKQNWFRDNPILTAFITVLSATFPPGEQMFIDSVRRHKDFVKDPDRLKEVTDFIRQEAAHTHHHRLLNDQLFKVGWRVDAVEERVANAIKKHNTRFRPITLLAGTVCLEHITAIIADWILNNTEVFENVSPSFVELMQWHALEEIEHKSVAFDVYMDAGGDRKSLRKAMRLVGIGFPLLCTIRTVYLLAKSRQMPSWKHFKEAYQVFFNKKNGFVTCVYRDFKLFYQEDFHPDKHDQVDLMMEWKKLIIAK